MTNERSRSPNRKLAVLEVSTTSSSTPPEWASAMMASMSKEISALKLTVEKEVSKVTDQVASLQTSVKDLGKANNALYEKFTLLEHTQQKDKKEARAI